MYEKGDGVEKDIEVAVGWNRRATDGRGVSAQFQMGVRYTEGSGVRQDHAEAARWYRKATDSGHHEASVRLGNLLFSVFLLAVFT
ncbi:MAG: sel1 repeat family protein [Alphaproteobacteria bacterium]|jgi:uncharacterized protein|nr:sel1 repeat family protein [Alphaproteobacteria bacterium]MBT5159841.1 sel1 repeat family protein [Alphaproteobacteria bacterium]MBT5919744.1 sel1 repeat family protein [Alphaproteobacteria bacterium]MBT6386359.1 sel1 repeat family protein [Alphaproteobacteria bacterium]